MITTRKANINDDKDFAELVLISAPYFNLLFGNKIKVVLQYLFRSNLNLFSHEHVYIAEHDGKKLGMILGYTWKDKKDENFRTGLLLFKQIGAVLLKNFLVLLKFNVTVGKVSDGEYYISNLATYLNSRGMGLGKKLIRQAEQVAKISGAKMIVLDVERDNFIAINLYEKLGFNKTKKFSISLKRNGVLNYYRMEKAL